MTAMPSSHPALQVADGRYELKFVAPPDTADWVVSQLKAHPARFRRAFPSRLVNNIYFDTENLEAYADNLSGISSRTKARYRWYGSENVSSDGAFELKFRRNQIGWKLQFPIPGLELIDNENWRLTARRLKKNLPDEAALWLDSFSRAVLINRYRRQYFITPDGNFRITVDDEVKTYNQWMSNRVNLRRAAERMPDGVIVEVKFDQAQREHASAIIDALSLRRSRHSKYMTGAEACFSQ